VWVVLDGSGAVSAHDSVGALTAEVRVDHAGAYELFAHGRHTAGALELRIGSGVRCHATCFTPGVL
jgi:hypothetical protein